MAASWHGGSYTKICLAAALAGSVGLALYYGYRKRQQSLEQGASGDKKKQDETQEKEAASEDTNKTAANNCVPTTEKGKYSVQPITENIKEICEVEKPKDLKLSSADVEKKTEELKSSVNAASEKVKEKADDLKSASARKAEELKSSARDASEKVKEKAGQLKSSITPKDVDKKTEELKSSVKAASEKIKQKAGELESLIDASLTESSFSILGDDKDEKKEKGELSTKDDNDIVVIEETPDKKGKKTEEQIIPETGSFAQSLPPLSDQPPSLSAFELSSLESSASASKDQPQSLSTYEFPSLEHEKSKNDNGSDIEVLPTEDKSTKSHEKPTSDTPGHSHIPKPKKDTKKTGATSIPPGAESEPAKDAKSKGRKGSKDIKRKDETDGTSTESQRKGKEATKAKPPPVPPKPKSKSDTPQPVAKEQEVHIKHPANNGEFVSFGMKFEAQDSTPDHLISGVEEGGPASEVGLKEGDMVLKLNDMDVTHWSRAVLIEQFRMIPSAEFDMTIKRNDQGKYLSVHIIDEGDGVAVSGVVIDVNSIPKSNKVSLKPVEGSEAVQKCHVISYTGACAQVTDQGLTLQEKLVDDESFTFEKINYKEGSSNIIILRTTHKGSSVYITVLNRSTVGVQVYTDMFSTYDMEEDVTQLETADPRCFYLIKTRGGSYWLESTQFPDHYLCSKGSQFLLVSLTQASEVATNRNIRFKFEPI